MKPRHYILDGHEPKPAELLEWASWFEKNERHVGDTKVGTKRVSTVFLGLDHSFGRPDPPMLFETMIFGSDDEYCERYATWDEAAAGHVKAVELAKANP